MNTGPANNNKKLALSYQDAKRLGANQKYYDRRPRNSVIAQRRFRGPGVNVMPVVLTSDLTAMAGSTPGTGTANPRTYDGTNLGVDATVSLDILSDFGTLVVSGTKIIVYSWSGQLWILSADCP